MCSCSRRRILATAGVAMAALVCLPAHAPALGDLERHFVAEALRMKNEALAAGDQPFGAVVVKADTIVGYGPSRVITDRNPDAHAERVALWDAQRRLARKDLAEAVLYSTSRPCVVCERALAAANVSRMRFGPDAADAGKPKAG